MLLSRRLLLTATILICTAVGGVVTAQDGCVSPFQYPFGTFTPDPSGIVTEISTCIYHQEYTHFTGFESGNTYRFDISGEGFITLREGTMDGPVLASGYAYVIFTATSNADIFAHYTKNEACVLATGCETSSVQLLLDCIPPQVWYTWEEDCVTGEFNLLLDISSQGDSPSLTVEYDSPGTSGTINDAGVGIYSVGPFTLSDVVNISVIHGNSAECDILFTGIQPFASCPIILECGGAATELSYCYENNADVFWTFQGDTDGALLLTFAAGTVGGGDILTIYDGPDAGSPILFTYTDWNNLDLTGLTFISTGSDMYITFVADGFGSCADFSQTAWDFSVACLNCNLPQATAYIMDDCENNQFFIQVDVASTGDGSTVDIEYSVNGLDPETISGAGLGQTDLGPFTVNDEVLVIIRHEVDGMCDVSLGMLTDANSCPTLIECGGDDFNATYCYTNNESSYWFYELVGDEGALYLQFLAGTIESAVWDVITIYDGSDVNAPILFEHTGGQFDLTGLAVTSTSGFLFMTLTSDGSVSCESGSQTSWEWVVTCLDCTPAVAAYQIIQDCENYQYFVDVNISNIGSDPELTITNTGGAPEVSVTAPGNVLIGPFTSGVPVQLTLVNDENSLCNVVSPEFINPLCPVIICGTTPFVETYCYTANDNMAWAYEVSGDGLIRMVFNRGTMESSNWDVLRIYDGVDNTADLLFVHDMFETIEFGPQGSAINGPGTFYYEIDITSTGPNLYMELTSDGSVQCETSMTYDPMEWEVFCEGCPAPGVEYQLVADCEHLVYKATVNVTEISGTEGLQITEVTSGEVIAANEVNAYNFATFFPLDSVISFQIMDLDNPGCTYESDSMVYTREMCVINSCGLDNYELCYENNEDRYYTFRSEGDFPVAIYFYQGQMLANDNIVLYNGLTETSNVIFSGNNGGNLAGLTVNSSNPDHALTLRILSDGSGSCVDQQATVPLRWDVGCGFVGIDEVSANNFSIYPNPTNGLLTIDMGETAEGMLTIRVMDMSGRVAMEEVVNAQSSARTTLDLGKLQNGQYMVQLITDNWIGTRSFQMMR